MARVRSKKPLHFPLTNQKLGELFTLDFTAAEWRLYLYLATLDPFGDTGVKYNAEEVMLFCNIKPAKYYEAKAKFVQLGLFKFTDGVTKVVNLKGFKANSHSPNVESNSPNVESNSPNVESNSPNVESNSPNVESNSPEPSLILVSEPPHTLSDLYKTNSNSLTKPTHHPQTERENFLTFNSEENGQDQKKFVKSFKDLDPEEREKFLAFSKRKADQLPKPPTLIQKWIERNFQELYEGFMRSNLPPQISRFENFESTDPNNHSNYDPEILNTLSLKLREAYVIASEGRLKIDSEGIVSLCEVNQC
jgi:hypothetical protein